MCTGSRALGWRAASCGSWDHRHHDAGPGMWIALVTAMICTLRLCKPELTRPSAAASAASGAIHGPLGEVGGSRCCAK